MAITMSADYVQPSSPPADPFSSGNWLAELTRLDTESAARRLTAMLQAAKPLAPSPDHLNRIRLVDEQCQPWFKQAQREFLAKLASDDTSSSRVICGAMQAAFHEMAESYHPYIAALLTTPSEAKVTELVELLTGRTIHCLAQYAKWGYFCHETLDKTVWMRLHSLYRFAESHGFEYNQMNLYRGPGEHDCTVSSRYIQNLLLDTLNTGNLTAWQIEIADHWLHGWSGNLALEPEYAADRHAYRIDLGMGQGARRATDTGHSEWCRHLETGDLEIQLERTRARLREGGLAFDSELDKNIPLSAYLGLLDKASRIWSAGWLSKDQRAYKRSAVTTPQHIDVVLGLPPTFEMCRMALDIAPSSAAPQAIPPAPEGSITWPDLSTIETEASLALGKSQPAQWPLRDESANGYGAILPRDATPSRLISTLVGIKHYRDQRWSVATIVRELAQEAGEQVLIGIEILGHTPIPVWLQRTATPAAQETIEALYLPGDPERNTAHSLVINRDHFSAAADFEILTSSASFRVRMNRIVRQGEGWVKAGIDVLGKKSRGDVT